MKLKSFSRIAVFGFLLLLLLLLPSPPESVAAPDLQANSAAVTRTFWHPAGNAPAMLGSPRASASGLGLGTSGVSPQEIALRFVNTFRADLNLTESAADWQTARVEVEGNGVNHVRMKQSYHGLPVFGSELIVHLSNDTVTAVNGQYLNAIQVDTQPALTAQAVFKAVTSVADYRFPQLRESQLVIFDPAILNTGTDQVHLAYSLVVDDPVADTSDTILVDAHTGKRLLQFSNYESARNRWIGDLNGGSTLPGTQCYNETGPVVGSPRADCTSAWTFTGNTYDYFFSTFARDSFDNHGAQMRASVYWGTTANAQWIGTQTRFGPGYATKDVVAHEWGHAVTQYTAGLIYSNQSGALNESFSDVFGAMVDRNDWLMGEDLPGGAIRSLADPTIYGQPGKASDFRCTTGDNGGVHTNSGISNHAAYLMADGGTYNGRTVVGFGRGPTERIFYRALTVYLGSSSSLNDAYNALANSAVDLYGYNSTTHVNTLLALQATEMNTSIVCGGTTTPDAYEQDNTAATANIITPNGSSQTHNFHFAGDNDWVKFTATAGNIYTIATSNLGATSDTYLYLYGTDGSTILMQDDDGGGGYASRIVWTATLNGTYYARVRHYSGSASGSTTNYDLRVTFVSSGVTPDAYEQDNTPATASTLAVNGSVQTHNFHFAGDNDWAKFTAYGGSTYTIATSNLGSTSDTYLYLYGTDGSTILMQNDDGGGGLASRIVWTATYGGVYYIRVRHYNSAAYGATTNYNLGVTTSMEAPDYWEPDNSAAQSPTITVNGVAQTHTFHIAGDNDWVRFSATAGIDYTLYTSNLGACSDTYLYLYSTDGTTILAYNDDSGGSLASRIDWTPTANGTYYARIRHYSASVLGSCTIYNFSIASVIPSIDIYEPDNTYAQASTLTVNGSAQSHYFHVAGDNDWAKFNAGIGTSYVIETFNLGSCGDTYLYLIGTDGSTVLLTDDDSGDGLASRITWTATGSGMYYVRVRHYSPSAYGSCTSYYLRATGTAPGADIYEPDNLYTQASTLTVNGSFQSHNFHVAGDNDWAKFTATSGTNYVIETLNLGSCGDTYMYLISTDGSTVLAIDDDSGLGLASRISWTASANGVYYARVRHYNTATYGSCTSYDLRVMAGADAYETDDTPAQASTLTVNGGAQTHNFHVARDIDWAKFSATSGTSYVIETLNLGSGSDTYLYLYSTDASTLITYNDDGGGGLASRIVWTPTSSGVYYVKVRHYSSSAYGSTTNYDLRVRTGTALASPSAFGSQVELSTKQARPGDQVTLTIYAAGDATSIKVNTMFKSAYLRLVDVTPTTSTGARAPTTAGRWIADTGSARGASAQYAPSSGLNVKAQTAVMQFSWQVAAPIGAVGLEIPIEVVALNESGVVIASETHTLWLYAPNGSGAPKIDQVQPLAVVSNADNYISIMGSDFVSTPKVYMQAGGNNTNVQDVVFVDATLLIVKIPAGFKADTYKVRVVNPDNNEASYDGFRVSQGGNLYLPLIIR